MLENIKIIFADLDGTALNSNGEFSDYTKNVFKQAVDKGIYVVLCSGRSNSDMIQKSKEANASSIIISSNGSMVFDYKENKKIYESAINMDFIKDIWNFAVSNDMNITLNGTYKRYKNESSKKNGIVISNLDEIDEEITQIVIDTKEFEKITYLKNLVKSYDELEAKNYGTQIFNNFGPTEDGFELDIVNKGNNKGIAVRKLLRYLNLNDDNSLCFGDQMNDYDMFQECGITVAMENGADDLKVRANYIAKPNDEDGVAEFIEEYLF